MPKVTFTPEEQEAINQLTDQINVSMRTQGGAIFLNVIMPPYPEDLGAPPMPNQQVVASANALSIDNALEQAEGNVNTQIDNVERQIEEWLTMYRRRLAFYRAAVANATKAFEREPKA